MTLPKASYRSADIAPPTAFASFTFAGVVYIVVSKLLGFHPTLVIIVPVLLMVIYAGLILSIRRLRLRDDQTGDNFYYMGFIFTLVSLSIALYQYGGGADVDEIVRNFGIAVSSTITGIAFRIFFNQIRRDPVEVEHVSRLELAEASRRVRRELDSILQEMAHFRRTNQQMLDEGFHEVRTKMSESATSMLLELERFTREAAGKLSASAAAMDIAVDLGSLKGQLGEIASTTKGLNSALVEATSGVSRAAKGARDKLEAMATPDKVIEVSMQPVVDSLQSAISVAVQRLDTGIHELHQLRAVIEKSDRPNSRTRIFWPFGIKKRAQTEPKHQ